MILGSECIIFVFKADEKKCILLIHHLILLHYLHNVLQHFDIIFKVLKLESFATQTATTLAGVRFPIALAVITSGVNMDVAETRTTVKTIAVLSELCVIMSSNHVFSVFFHKTSKCSRLPPFRTSGPSWTDLPLMALRSGWIIPSALVHGGYGEWCLYGYCRRYYDFINYYCLK